MSVPKKRDGPSRKNSLATAHRTPQTRSPGRARPRSINADAAKLAAIEHCLFHYPTLYTGGVPRHASRGDNRFWIVPIVLEDPDVGLSAEVGELRIDARTGKVVFSTPRAAVVRIGAQLYEERRDANGAAFVPTKED